MKTEITIKAIDRKGEECKGCCFIWGNGEGCSVNKDIINSLGLPDCEEFGVIYKKRTLSNGAREKILKLCRELELIKSDVIREALGE